MWGPGREACPCTRHFAAQAGAPLLAAAGGAAAWAGLLTWPSPRQGSRSSPGSPAPPLSTTPRQGPWTQSPQSLIHHRAAALTPATSSTRWIGTVGVGTSGDLALGAAATAIQAGTASVGSAGCRGSPACRRPLGLNASTLLGRLDPPLWGFRRRLTPLSCLLCFSEEKDTETSPESHFAKENLSTLAEDAGGSEPSDEEAATPSTESRDAADEDTPGPAARLPERDLIFDGATPATPQEPTRQEDSVDLLGLHAEAGLAPPVQASGAAPSTADLLSRLLGGPDAAPEVPPGDLLGGEAPLLFASPAPSSSAQSPPREGPAGTFVRPVSSGASGGVALLSGFPGRVC